MRACAIDSLATKGHGVSHASCSIFYILIFFDLCYNQHMYRTKPYKNCDMPACDEAKAALPIKVLVLNASLKHGPELSNTEEVAQLVLKEMAEHGTVESEII